MSKSELPQMMLNVRRLPTLGTVVKLKAAPAELRAMAKFLELDGISIFTSQMKFRPWAKDGVQLDGQLSASLNTQCPITLNPVPQQIDTSFKSKFAPEGSRLAKPLLNEEGEMILDAESDDIPDIYEGEELDAWAIALEYLSLEIDPFARSEGAEFTPISQETDTNSEIPSPFAALQSLKK